MTVTNPFGHDFADSACGLKSDRVQTSGDETILQLGRFSYVITHIRSEAFRATEKLLDAGIAQGRYTSHGIEKNGLEMFKVTGDFIEAEIFRDTIRPPQPGLWLEGSDQQLARIVFVIGTGVVIAQDRETRIQSHNGFEQNVIVLAGMQWHVYANRCRQIARPHSAANHHIICIDIPVCGADAGYFDPIVTNPRYFRILKDSCTTTARAFRERLRYINSISITVGWNMDAAYKVVCTYEREKFGNLVNRNDFDLQVEHFGH